MENKKYNIFKQEYKKGKDKYTFYIDEVVYTAIYWRRCTKKFYGILKNGEDYLYTSLHQTYYAEKRKIMKEEL